MFVIRYSNQPGFRLVSARFPLPPSLSPLVNTYCITILVFVPVGEVLDGDRMAHSMYNFEFKRDLNEILLCKTSISPAEIRVLKGAIEDLYYFEFSLDDLPIRGFVGHFEEGGIAPLHEHKVSRVSFSAA